MKSVWQKVRQIVSKRKRYGSIERKLLAYVYKFPRRTLAHIGKRFNVVNYRKQTDVNDFRYVFKSLFDENLICLRNTSRFDDESLFVIIPSQEPSDDGLWLVDPKTSELLRPKTKIEDIIGRFYKKGEDVFISLPNNKTYELVNGYEYGAKTYSRDYKKRRNIRVR